MPGRHKKYKTFPGEFAPVSAEFGEGFYGLNQGEGPYRPVKESSAYNAGPAIASIIMGVPESVPAKPGDLKRVSLQ